MNNGYRLKPTEGESEYSRTMDENGILMVCLANIYSNSFADGSIRNECVIFAEADSMAETAQYFVVESSMARSTSSGLIPSPKKTYSI